MATAEEGGATDNTTSSSYGGGGVGGKFRKKPFRRQTTPYDRPSTALRGNNDNNSSWLKKLVVEPASKLISYGAGRFFAPLLRKRLPPPPPPQPPVCGLFVVSRNMYLLMLAEAEVGITEGGQGTVLNRPVLAIDREVPAFGTIAAANLFATLLAIATATVAIDNYGVGIHSQDGAHGPSGGGYSQPMNMDSSNGISELEHLLKQRTFTRSEVVHLRELLQSRAVELSFGDVGQINEDNALDFARRQQFESGCVRENRNGGNRSYAPMSTPIVNSKVIEDDNASPAELAKAYMGTRPSKVSPSVLGIRSRVGKEDLLSSLRSASGSPIMALTKKTGIMAAPDNGFITPRSRGRSALYNMARTPYSKVHVTSSLKGSGINSNGYDGPSMSSSFLPESDEKLGSRPVSSKRRSSVLDDELGSIGSIRRIRQKSNLLASRLQPTTHAVGIGSRAKQKLQLIGEPSHKLSKDVGENENGSVPSTSYGHVPSKSNEVATKILQHLEKMTPKERSSESKLVARRDKSPLKLIPSMLSGQALRSMEDVDSSKLMLDLQDGHKLGDRSNATLAEARDFSMQKEEKVEENGPKESVAPSDKWSPVANIDSVVSSKASMPSSSTTDSISKTGASQPQKKRAFRMSAEEDYFCQDDDAHCKGLASRPLSGNQGPTESSLADTSKVAPFEESRLVKPSIQAVDQSPLDIISGKTNEPNSGAVTLGEVSSVVSFPVSEGTMAASQSAVIPFSVAAFNKSKEENNHPLFGFNSKVVKNVASSPSESSKGMEFKIESSSSLFNVSASIGSKTKIPQSEESSHLNLFKAEDVNGKSVSVPSAASNGPSISSSHPPLSFSAASSYDTNQISKDTAFPVPSSTGTSTPATSSDSMFGVAAAKPSSLGGFQFGSPVVNPVTSVSAASTSVSEAAVGSKNEIVSNSGRSTGSLSSVVAFAATSSASNNTYGISSSVGFVAPNTLQGSLFDNATKPVGFGLQDNSSQPVSSAAALLPAFNTSSNTTSFGSSSSSQVSNPSTSFAFRPLATSEDKSVFKFGATATESSAVSSSSGSTTGIFGSNNGPLFSSFATAPGSAPSTTTASSPTSSGAFTTAIAGSSLVSRNSLASSSSAPSSSLFGSSWQNPNPSTAFGSSTFTAPSNSTGSLFSPVSSAPTTSVFNPPSLNPMFSFTTPSPSFLSSPSASVGQHGFGASASPDQMNAEDSMSEDPVQQQHQLSAVSPMFGQPAPSSTFTFGLQQPGPFMFAGQQNQIALPQNPSPFQASGSLGFSAGGNFSLGSGGGEKSGRKIVKISRSKNRKK
ncbi:hypothetical protein OROGR_031080 [Orobanche gracilis]